MPAPSPVELHDAWQAGRAAWPGVEIDEATFAAHLVARTPATTTISPHAIDLYLACACVADVGDARAIYARAFLGNLGPIVGRLDPDPSFVDEVRQRAAERLIVGPSKLADYAGRGSLAAWTNVVATRIALDLRAERRPQALQPLDDALAALPAEDDPELDYLRERYVPAFRDALREAIAQLTSQQRNVLRLHLVSGVTTDKIGTLYQVNQSTVVRWLQAARAAIRVEAEARLRAALDVSPSELASIAQLVLSRLDLGITGILKAEVTVTSK